MKLRWRKGILALLIVCVTVLMALPFNTFAQSRSVYWERWDVLIDEVDTAANRFRVTEAYDINFTGSFSFGSVVIPYTNLERIEDIQVYENGRALTQRCNGNSGTFCSERDGDELSITYYFFNSANNEKRNFEIVYTVIGALRVYEGGDQLWWNAIPPEHFGFSIGSATIRVVLPDGFAPREGIDPVETYGAPSDVRVNGVNVTATATEALDGNGYFYIRLQYPHDPNARVAGWQASFDQSQAFNENVRPVLDIGVLAASLLTGLGLPLFIFTRYQAKGRDPDIGVVPTYLTEPPSSLPPAVVGTLVDERADLRDVMSTVLDLAHRGYMVIEESQTEGLFGFGKTSSYTFKRTDKSINGEELRPFEVRLLTNLFSGNRMERSLDSLKTVFYSVIQSIQGDLYKELVKEGFFTQDPNTTRSMWQFIGIGILMGAGVIGFLLIGAIEDLTPALLCLPVALGLGGVAALLVSSAMPAKTRKGAEEAAKWMAFVEYLRNLEKYADVEQAAQTFDNYLPYAVAAGLDRSWIQRFSHVESVPIPTWYYPTYMGRYRRGYMAGTPLSTNLGGGRGNSMMPGELARAGDGGGFSLDTMSEGVGGALENISSGLTNMLDSAGRVMTSVPQQTNSSGRWSSGGGSFSGGGGGFSGGSGGGSRGFG